MVQNQVQVGNNQRRNFLWIPKNKCLEALAWWDNNFTLKGKKIVLADFYVTMMADCLDESKLDYEDGNKDQDIEKPDKLSHIKWVAWKEMVYT